MDIVNFLRENGQMKYNEAMAYYCIRYFDSDEDGKLDFNDWC